MADPYYDQTVLFLPFERPGGAPGFNTNAAWDFSKFRRPITVSSMPDLPASPLVKYGNYSAYFNPTGSYTNRFIRTTDLTGLAFTGDFTIECWVYPFSFGATWGSWLLDTRNTSVASGTGYYLFFGWSTNNHKVTFGNSGIHADLLSDAVLTTNTWSHIAVVRNSGVLNMYINGVAQTQTISHAGSYTASTFNLGVAANDAVTTGISGYVDEYRITLAPRYTSNFIPTQIDIANYPLNPYTPRNIQIGSSTRVDYKDPYFGSQSITTAGTISGIVKNGAVPVKRRVRLYESSTGNFVREVWAGLDGTFVFKGLDKNKRFTITSHDHLTGYNDVIAARATPV